MKVQNFLLYIYYFESESRSVMSDSLKPHGLYSSRNSPDQITGVGSLSLLQGIFPTQGLSPGLPHCRWILYQLSQQGSPRILEWVTYPFSSRSSQPRNQTGVSCIAGDSLPTELWGKPLRAEFSQRAYISETEKITVKAQIIRAKVNRTLTLLLIKE